MDVCAGIFIEHVGYAYGETRALNDISFTVAPGRFTALLGPNGAGKSTLVALLTGLFVPDAGRIRVLGHDLVREPRAALGRIGVVFQGQTLDVDLSVHQNMHYFANLQGLAGRAVAERIDACLDRMGLAERIDERVRKLNSGHRRRLEIARALLHRPRVLLLDEPTVGLDVPSRSAIVEHVHAICIEEDITVLWATHLVDEVWPEDGLVVLHAGRIRDAGTVAEILARTGTANVLQAFTKLTDASGAGADTPP